MDAYTLSLAASIGSGLVLGLVGVTLLVGLPRRPQAVAFGVFLVCWAGWIVAGNASGIAASRGDLSAAHRLIVTYGAFYAISYLPLAYFGSTYPAARGPFTRTWWGAALLVLPAAVAAIVLLARPELLFEGIVTGGDRASSRWGPLYPVYFILFNGTMFGVLASLHRQRRRARNVAEKRRASSVLSAFSIYVAFWAGQTIVSRGWFLLTNDPGGLGGLPEAVFAGVGAVGLVLVLFLAWSAARDPRLPRSHRRFSVAAVVVPGAFGILSGYTITGGGGSGTLQTLGLWRTVAAIVILDALLRYELFDLDARVRRMMAGAVGLFTIVAVATGLQAGLEVAGVPTGLSVAIALSLVAVGLTVSWTRLTAFAWWARATEPTADRGTPEEHRRRLRVYETSVSKVVRDGYDPNTDALLADLRNRLGISTSEHGLIARLTISASNHVARAGEPFAVGSVIVDRYRLDGVIADRPGATVYKAWDLRGERPVAVKRQSGAGARGAARAAAVVASITHPNVVRVHDHFTDRGSAVVVMEYVDGGTLEDLIGAGEPLARDTIVRIMTQVLGGLDELHRRGMLHRDLKPENILVDRGWRARLADLGAVTAYGAPETHPVPGGPATIAGTPRYMSPEARRGGRLSRASDIYSAGVVLMDMITLRRSAGREPFDLRGVQAATPLAPTVAGEDPRDAAVLRIVQRATAPEPGDRYADVAEMARDLEAVERMADREPPIGGGDTEPSTSS